LGKLLIKKQGIKVAQKLILVESLDFLEVNRSHQDQHVGVCQSDNSSTTVARIQKYHIVPIFQSASGEELYQSPSQDPDI
jgi:hypothetical protein